MQPSGTRFFEMFTMVAVLLAPAGAAFSGPPSKEDKAVPPVVGDTADDFELAGLDGKKVFLSKLLDRGPVVLVVLRGYPGYQCPVCTKQVGQLVGSADKIRDAGATVVLVYPGPSHKLNEHAEQFVAGKKLPEGFQLLVDPDFRFTNAYHLRWNAPAETAYPSTFVIGKDRKVRFAKVSKTHGGRATVDEVLAAFRE